MPPAARLSDFHQCPLSTPVGPVQVPHVGGPIAGPGAVSVLIGGLPAAKVGDVAVCVGPPDSLIQGSTTVQVMGLPAVRMGDKTAHGGTVLLGLPTVLIGG
ncbi:MAG: PAAR domain-containing protein [Acidobacteriota bacterium]